MRALSERDRQRARRLRLWGLAAAAAVVLGGCASSPEAARVRGEPGADPGNHGNPVVARWRRQTVSIASITKFPMTSKGRAKIRRSRES